MSAYCYHYQRPQKARINYACKNCAKSDNPSHLWMFVCGCVLSVFSKHVLSAWSKLQTMLVVFLRCGRDGPTSFGTVCDASCLRYIVSGALTLRVNFAEPSKPIAAKLISRLCFRTGSLLSSLGYLATKQTPYVTSCR